MILIHLLLDHQNYHIFILFIRNFHHAEDPFFYLYAFSSSDEFRKEPTLTIYVTWVYPKALISYIYRMFVLMGGGGRLKR